jgi:hypothetical protein
VRSENVLSRIQGRLYQKEENKIQKRVKRGLESPLFSKSISTKNKILLKITMIKPFLFALKKLRKEGGKWFS